MNRLAVARALALSATCLLLAAPPARADDDLVCSAPGGFWLRTRLAPVRRGCGWLVRASARLEAEPGLARDWARQAHGELASVGHPEASRAWALWASAELLAGDASAAAARFAQLAPGVRLPFSLLVWRARAAAASGQNESALAAYREVVGRATGSTSLTGAREGGAPMGARDSVRPSSVGQSSAGLSSAMQSSGVQSPAGHSPTGPRESTRLWLEAAFAALAVGDERLREANTYAEEAERAGEPLLAPLARALRVHIAERSGDEVLASELARAAFDPFALRGLIDNAPAPSPARDGLLPFVRREQLLALADSWEKLAQPVRGAARGPTGGAARGPTGAER